MIIQNPVASFIQHQKREALIARLRRYISARDAESLRRLAILRDAYQRATNNDTAEQETA